MDNGNHQGFKENVQRASLLYWLPPFYLEGCMLYRLPSNIDGIVDKWVAEHPAKTYNAIINQKEGDTNG